MKSTMELIWLFIGKDQIYLTLWSLYIINFIFNSGGIAILIIIISSLLVGIKHEVLTEQNKQGGENDS